jgi:zinc finger CCCH domain-containing protein 13
MERKLSKRKSNPGSSVWSRPLKRSPTAPPVQSSPIDLTRNPSSGAQHEKGGGEEKQRTDRSQQYPRLKSSVSANAGITNSSVKDTWTSVPLPNFKVKYHLHNPLGPRWYRNHHLIPPSQIRPSLRPPTFFSPSFPPISSSSMPERSEDAAGTSGTPSHSPLPTPDSSQTRVADGGRPRSRKTSQTTPDNVDLLDVTDPWGTNWHHQSPYDVFGQTATTSPETQDVRDRSLLFQVTFETNPFIISFQIARDVLA